jgi:hypothetical protein
MTEVTDKQVSTDTPSPVSTPQDNTQQPTGIQISDLQTVLNIIDLASSRGAFRANELTQVGTIADKLGGFLRGLAEQDKAKQEAIEKAEGSTKAPAEVKAPTEEKKEE